MEMKIPAGMRAFMQAFRIFPVISTNGTVNPITVTFPQAKGADAVNLTGVNYKLEISANQNFLPVATTPYDSTTYPVSGVVINPAAGQAWLRLTQSKAGYTTMVATKFVR